MAFIIIKVLNRKWIAEIWPTRSSNSSYQPSAVGRQLRAKTKFNIHISPNSLPTACSF